MEDGPTGHPPDNGKPVEKTYPGLLTMGTVFYLTEDKKFRDVMEEFHGFHKSKNPDTPPGSVMRYRCEAGYVTEIRTDVPVWKEV